MTPGEFEPSALQIQGVKINVRPEARLTTPSGRIGAIKLYLSKSHPLSIDAGQCAASLVQALLRDALGLVGTRYSDCILLDIFAGNVFTAPSNFKARMRDVDAACEEIARAWVTA